MPSVLRQAVMRLDVGEDRRTDKVPGPIHRPLHQQPAFLRADGKKSMNAHLSPRINHGSYLGARLYRIPNG